jgi:tetratricopeptide (TPR) repeat protein
MNESSGTSGTTGRPEGVGISEEARQEAMAHYRRGVYYAGEGLLDKAATAYERAVEIVPGYEPAWFNLGLVYKWQKRWAESLRCNRRAADLDSKNEAAWWNLGIAATALRDWPVARAAWRGFGLDIPDGEGPLDLRYGRVCVRLNPDTSGEVVWCRRIDPARAVIQNIPLPASRHRWGDVVLHDGEPKGERVWGGRTYVVFDELERWESSPTPTLRVPVTAPAAEDAQALVALFEARGYAAEDWTTSVRRLCRACSEGRPHAHHDADLEAWEPERDCGIAAPPDVARDVVHGWQAAASGRRAGAIAEVA